MIRYLRCLLLVGSLFLLCPGWLHARLLVGTMIDSSGAVPLAGAEILLTHAIDADR